VTGPLSPEVFGDFLLVHRMATSNMAEALVGVRLGDRSGRTFVVKRPALGERASGAAAQAILREAEALHQIRSGTVVSLEAAGEICGLPYLALEHIRGAPLDALLAHHGKLPRDVIVAIARDLAKGLAAVHEAGWVHGDVAPSNVLIDDGGEAKLVDFGLAARIGERRHTLAGKPGYIAPELLHATHAEASADAYGWGVILAECATGRRLFTERNLTEAAARGELPPRVATLEHWGALLGRVLDRDPHARPSASSLVSELEGDDADRARLAELVASTMATPPDERTSVAYASPLRGRSETLPTPAMAEGFTGSTALTPTAPASTVSRTIAEDTEPAMIADEIIAPVRARTARDHAPPRRRLALVVALVSVALVAGLFGRALGRRSMQHREGRVSILGKLPPRIVIEIDGRRVEPPVDGASLPLEPGRHTMKVKVPNRKAKDVPFSVQPGESVVLIPFPQKRRR